jgi:hypothetical protein
VITTRRAFPITRSPDDPMCPPPPSRHYESKGVTGRHPGVTLWLRGAKSGAPRKPGFGLLGWKFAAPQPVMVSDAPLLRGVEPSRSREAHPHRITRWLSCQRSRPNPAYSKSDQSTSFRSRGDELFSTVPAQGTSSALPKARAQRSGARSKLLSDLFGSISYLFLNYWRL